MLQDENPVGEHHQNALPFLLLDFGAREEVETRPQVDLIHPNEAARENDRRCHVDIEVVADTPEAILPEDEGNVDEKANQVDTNDRVPLHGAGEPTEHHHDEPGGEGLIKVKVLDILGYGLSSSQQAHYGNHR